MPAADGDHGHGPPPGGTVRAMWDDVPAPPATLAGGAPWLDDGVAISAAYGDWSFTLAGATPAANERPHSSPARSGTQHGLHPTTGTTRVSRLCSSTGGR